MRYQASERQSRMLHRVQIPDFRSLPRRGAQVSPWLCYCALAGPIPAALFDTSLTGGDAIPGGVEGLHGPLRPLQNVSGSAPLSDSLAVPGV